MSRDPKRLLDESLSDDERRALVAGESLDPPADLHGAVLAGVLSQVGPAGGGPPPDGGAVGAGGSLAAGAGAKGLAGTAASAKAGGALTFAGLIKAFGVGGGLTAAALAGHELSREPEPSGTEPVGVASAAPAAAPTGSQRRVFEAAPDAATQPAVTRVVPSPVLAVPSDAGADRDETYGARWESAWVARARAQLRQGDPSGALAMLAEIDRKVPGGVLGQEREALAIEALARSGQAESASRRAKSFVDRFPSSPHVSSVRAFIRE